MFVHHPRTNDFVKSVPNATRVHFNFTFDGGTNFHSNDIRTKKDGDFMGCIGDLGWYCTRMGLLVFSRADGNNLHGLVTDVQVTRFELNDEGVPIDAECLVYFTEVNKYGLEDEYLMSISYPDSVTLLLYYCKRAASYPFTAAFNILSIKQYTSLGMVVDTLPL